MCVTFLGQTLKTRAVGVSAVRPGHADGQSIAEGTTPGRARVDQLEQLLPPQLEPHDDPPPQDEPPHEPELHEPPLPQQFPPLHQASPEPPEWPESVSHDQSELDVPDEHPYPFVPDDPAPDLAMA